MTYQTTHASTPPARTALDAMPGTTVVEFGTPWCPHCIGAQPLIEQALHAHHGIQHVKVEDGPGQALGRSYRVKLWPTLIFLRDGVEVARVVRPADAAALEAAVQALQVAP